jgi:diguanylate cyclase (GGDEF)-like protein
MLQPLTDIPAQTLRHMLIIEDGQGCRSIPLKGNSYSLGRSATNAIVLHSKRVSRQHALLLRVPEPQPDQYRFRIIDGDLQGNRSTNGLFVNGDRCLSHDLAHGDLIEFGSEVKARYFSSVSPFDSAELEFLEDFHAGNLSQIHREGVKGTVVAEREQLPQSNESAIARMASFPELSPHPILEINLSGTITYLNPATSDKFPDLQVRGLAHPVLAGLVTAIQQGQGDFFTRQIQVDDQYFEQSIHYLAAGQIIRCFITDVTQRFQTEAELRKRDRLLQAVATSTTFLLSEPDFTAGIAKAIANLGEALGVDRIGIVENHPHPSSGDIAMTMRHEWQRDGIPSVMGQEHWQNQSYNAEGLIRWYEVMALGQTVSGLTRDFSTQERRLLETDAIQSILMVPIQVDNCFWGYISLAECCAPRPWTPTEEAMLVTMSTSVSGAIQRNTTEEFIRYQANHDQLTGLPNRSLFSDRLELSLTHAERNQIHAAVMFLDLDRFKSINDTLGHSIGDQLLQGVAKRLKAVLRQEDTFARWGGDEFIVLLPHLNEPREAGQTADRLLGAFEQPFFIDSHELYISPSIGIAAFPGDGEDGETLVKHADTALYQAKQAGRNNFQFFDLAQASSTPKILNLEKRLRQALEAEQFILYYQPQVDLKTGQVTGVEALLRWQDPGMGLVSPQIFMPVVEESGLIIPIGEWVLRAACLQNKAWQDQGIPPITVAVNLSARQLRQPNLTAVIAKTLQESGLDPRHLELEITETTAVQDVEFTKTVLQDIQHMGVRISMDDFGTGYSSLSYLQQLPLDSLKIDRSFITDLATNPKDSQIVTAIVSMAHGLRLNVIAEGVETLQQLQFLQSLNCQEGQGYFFNRPLSPADAAVVLQEGKKSLV